MCSVKRIFRSNNRDFLDTFQFNSSISQTATNRFSLRFKRHIIEQYITEENCVLLVCNIIKTVLYSELRLLDLAVSWTHSTYIYISLNSL